MRAILRRFAPESGARKKAMPRRGFHATLSFCIKNPVHMALTGKNRGSILPGPFARQSRVAGIRE